MDFIRIETFALLKILPVGKGKGVGEKREGWELRGANYSYIKKS